MTPPILQEMAEAIEKSDYSQGFASSEDAAKAALATIEPLLREMAKALERISRARGTYRGLPCKNMAADIADKALALYREKLGVSDEQRTVE